MTEKTRQGPAEDVVVTGRPLKETEREELETKPYQYRAGVGPHLHEGRALKVGDVVDLTKAQAQAFSDKFIVVDREVQGTPYPPTREPIAQTSSIRQDINATTHDPTKERVNPDNRVGMSPAPFAAQTVMESPMQVPLLAEVPEAKPGAPLEVPASQGGKSPAGPPSPPSPK